MLLGLTISFYFVFLVSFSFSVHPVINCFLLLGGIVCISGFVYMLTGFSWYLIMFCLVYIGGVIILFLFVSVFSPNPLLSVGGGYSLVLVTFFWFLVFWGAINDSFVCFEEMSHYLCSGVEGYNYCFFCIVLLLGFSLVSIISSGKDSFFR